MAAAQLKMRAPSRGMLVLGLACGLALAALSTRVVRVNVSPSLPYGLYRYQPLTLPVARGTLVLLPLPARMQPWHSRTTLLKPVAAVAGDTVCVEHATLAILGHSYGPVYAYDQRGASLPHLTDGCFAVPEGQVFLASPAPRSLDSRYFSSVAVADLTAQATPLMTWR